MQSYLCDLLYSTVETGLFGARLAALRLTHVSTALLVKPIAAFLCGSFLLRYYPLNNDALWMLH